MHLLAALLFATAPCLPETGTPGTVADPVIEPQPEPHRVALRATKILTASRQGPAVIDNGILLMEDGKITALGSARELEVPEGYELIDVRPNWLMPGIVELHNHCSSGLLPFPPDLNDSVLLANPGLRVACAVVPDNKLLRRGVAGGVTTALFIPGSGSNMGGAGVLLKIGLDTYEEMEVRNPGSLKVAQAGNPESWTVGVGRSMMNWNTRTAFKRGRQYHEAWKKHEEEGGPEPRKDPQWMIFQDLFALKTQVSVHTQIYQVVLMTITMLKMELGLDVYIDHGSFDGYRTAELAQEVGVAAILGPRAISTHINGFVDQDGKILGIAGEYQRRGHTEVGFNTDCVENGAFILPPQEELQLQAGMGIRYGMDDSQQASVRGLTIVPATAAGLGDRLGSLDVGKDADVVVISGGPADPRSVVSLVFTNGEIVYDTRSEKRRW